MSYRPLVSRLESLSLAQDGGRARRPVRPALASLFLRPSCSAVPLADSLLGSARTALGFLLIARPSYIRIDSHGWRITYDEKSISLITDSRTRTAIVTCSHGFLVYACVWYLLPLRHPSPSRPRSACDARVLFHPHHLALVSNLHAQCRQRKWLIRAQARSCAFKILPSLRHQALVLTFAVNCSLSRVRLDPPSPALTYTRSHTPILASPRSHIKSSRLRSLSTARRAVCSRTRRLTPTHTLSEICAARPGSLLPRPPIFTVIYTCTIAAINNTALPLYRPYYQGPPCPSLLLQ